MEQGFQQRSEGCGTLANRRQADAEFAPVSIAMGLSEMSADAIFDAADFALLFEYLCADSPHPPALGESCRSG
jgi:hypothetical protein